jgi:predicted ATPase
MNIKSLDLKSGGTVNLNKITIFVGANNSGKSRTLKDIRDIMVSGGNAKPVILKSIE